MSEPKEEITTPEVEEDMSVGKIMKESGQKAIRGVVIGAGALIYLAGVAYAEVHALNILTNGVEPDMLVWAYLGMVALGLSAIFLPLALHFWTFDTTHRGAAFAFYVVDIALLGVNSFVDFNVNEGQRLADWAQMYHDYILPSTPIIAAIGWAILLLLDPSSRGLVLRQKLRAAIMEAKSKQIALAADKISVNDAVKDAADREVDSTLTELFGKPVTPVQAYQVKESDTKAAKMEVKNENPTQAAP